MGDIATARRELGLSQSALASASGVSLATVQKVEAGRANPSVSTLTHLLRPLGLALRVAEQPVDWEALIALGLPMQGSARELRLRDPLTLRSHVGRAVRELTAVDPHDGESARRRECVEAMLLALDLHYPSVVRRWFAGAPSVRDFLPTRPTGRHRKLARIARAQMADYL